MFIISIKEKNEKKEKSFKNNFQIMIIIYENKLKKRTYFFILDNNIGILFIYLKNILS
jgi:hypothetical protein